MKRREFAKCVSMGGAMLAGMGSAAQGLDRPQSSATGETWPSLTLRPYQLLCSEQPKG